ncbi:MAG TPA: pyridoxine 5'-phosphate synthase [Gemmatales bacterium]|nr:pyridoxine 5'-phosphate synthase [Gemmatales bacterium]
MTKLSVNINKFATLRNSRGGNVPDVVQAALDSQRFGAQGITVHPRPDERHIRYSDVHALAPVITTELNIEGNPREEKFIQLVLEVKPTQVTLVPDEPGQITSNHGWDTVAHQEYLKEVISGFQEVGIRTSIFIDPILERIDAAKSTGTDRIELYTEPYAAMFPTDPAAAVAPFVAAARHATELGLGLNAGHDLNLDNLRYLKEQIPQLQEVSIGHALIADALYHGLRRTIQMYLAELQ